MTAIGFAEAAEDKGLACGQHMGRPPKLTPQQQEAARQRRAEGATLKELTKSYNVGMATISRLTE
jgi:transposase